MSEAKMAQVGRSRTPVESRRRARNGGTAKAHARAWRRFVRGRRARSGAMAAEFALVLPVLIAVMLGIIEFGWLYFVENEMAYVARSVSRDVSVGTHSVAEAKAEVESRLSHFGYAFVVPDASVVSNEVTINVSVPTSEAALLDFLGIFGSGSIDISVTMALEP